MTDNFTREINYARISLTDKCNFRCLYCMPECGIEKKQHSDIVSLDNILDIIKALSELGIKKVRFTGGEPLVRNGAVDLMKKVRDEIPAIKDICITTNGVLLPQYAKELSEIGINGLNISIDSFDPEKYSFITRGGKLDDALKGFKCAKDAGIENIKINAVLLKGINDGSIREFADFGLNNNTEVRFIELMPFSFGNSYDKYGITSREVIENNSLIKTERDTFTNNTEYYQFSDGAEVGFIRPISNKFCSKCNRIRITADGKMLLCLHRTDEIDLKGSFGKFDELKGLLCEGIKNKPEGHDLCGGNLQTRAMNRIGG